MTRKKQVNNENGTVLNRDFPRRSRSLIIGAEKLRRLFPNVKPEYIDLAIKRFGNYRFGDDENEIGGTDAQMPEVKQTPAPSANTPVNATYEPTEPHPEPVPRKIRKSGTGCLYQINDHLWEGSFYPRLPNGKRKKFNIYADTREECEEKLAVMIAQKNAEIATEKERLKSRQTA